MTNAEYWKQRFTQLEAAQNRKGAGAYLEIEKQYKAAQNELEAQIARWYQRFADSNGISLAQAKQWLKGQDLAEFKWDVKEYIKYGKENAINGAWMQELENASSKFHISRLEALQIQTQNSLETMFAQLGPEFPGPEHPSAPAEAAGGSRPERDVSPERPVDRLRQRPRLHAG